MNCKKCSGELKIVPAGISRKTGKPYNAFYSCSLCKTPDRTPVISGTPTPINQSVQVVQDKKFWLDELKSEFAEIKLSINDIRDKVTYLAEQEDIRRAKSL